MASLMVSFHKNVYSSLRSIYRPRYILLNVALAALYYYIYTFILASQDEGILLFLVPQYVFYLLVVTSAVALTIAVYSISNTRNNHAKASASAVGTVTTVFGGIVSGCGCAGSFVLGLTAFGVSASDTIVMENLISAYQLPLMVVMIAINLAVSLYYLNKLSTPRCRMRTRK